MGSEGARATGRVGVREVARHAGVSTQTVSRVINGHPYVREDTRSRVEAAMADLGYRVNNAARALGTRRSRTLGVIASDATLFGPSVGIAALERAAREKGLWIATAYTDAADADAVAEAARHLVAQGVDGLILVAAQSEMAETVRATASSVELPVAELHGGDGAGAQETAAALVVDHLASLGHRRIGRVGGPPSWLEERSRLAGHARALAAHAVSAGPQWSEDWSSRAGAAIADSVVAAIRAPEGPTAIVVANDQMALGLMSGLAAAGVDVPREVSITGFDDNPDAAHYLPALTTVRLDLAGEARRAVAEVTGADPAPPGAPQLIVRASTAPPRES